MDGWAPDERVQLEETPNVRVEAFPSTEIEQVNDCG